MCFVFRALTYKFFIEVTDYVGALNVLLRKYGFVDTVCDNIRLSR